VPLGAEGGDQATVHRLAIDQHGTGAAVAGIAAFLDAEMPGFRAKKFAGIARRADFAKIPCR